MFHTENPQIVDNTVKDLVAHATWHPGFMPPADLWF